MKRCKRIIGILISMIMALMLLPAAAFAAGAMDPEAAISLKLSYLDGETALSGASFDIYHVADVSESGELTATEAFRGYNVNLRVEESDAWLTLASTLEGYVLRDKVAAQDSGTTGEDGVISFPTGDQKLPQGLYLVLGKRHTQNGCSYDAIPFMVLIPYQDSESGEWVYDAAAAVKYEKAKVPEETPDKPGYPAGTTINRRVLKVWDDDGYESSRPQEVEIQLLRNGEVYDTVRLNAGNNWGYTWEKLSDAYTWTVTEKTCEDYTVAIKREGITFVVTNTHEKETVVPTTPAAPTTPTSVGTKLPQTGQLWWPVPLLMCAGLLLIVVGAARRRGVMAPAAALQGAASQSVQSGETGFQGAAVSPAASQSTGSQGASVQETVSSQAGSAQESAASQEAAIQETAGQNETAGHESES